MTTQTLQLPSGYSLKDGLIYSTIKEGKNKGELYREGIPAVIFARGFTLDSESNFYDIDLDQEALNRKIFHKEIAESKYDKYQEYGRLNELVGDLRSTSDFKYCQYYLRGKIILRTFAVETNDKNFHIEKVRFMLDYIKSFGCKVAVYTNNMGRLFDDLGTTKYLIRRLVEEKKLDIHFMNLGFCLNSDTLEKNGFLKEDTSV